jgi:hypothetical protein
MKTTRRLVLHRVTMSALVVTAAATTLFLATPLSATSTPRILSSREMEVLVGDSISCTQTFACTVGFTSGVSNCFKCSGSTQNRIVCCTCQTPGCKCDLTGPNQCTDGTPVLGPIAGQAGSCGTCNSNNWTVQGTCNTNAGVAGPGCQQ